MRVRFVLHLVFFNKLITGIRKIMQKTLHDRNDRTPRPNPKHKKSLDHSKLAQESRNLDSFPPLAFNVYRRQIPVIRIRRYQAALYLQKLAFCLRSLILSVPTFDN